MLVAGVDSSTQSTKVLLCQAEDGRVLAQGSAPHPAGTECDPAAWWEALQEAGAGLLNRADAIGIAGQQHGMIALDEAGEVVRPALLWNDLRSARAAAQLVDEFGGPAWWAEEAGSVPTASFTVSKLRWMADREAALAARTATVLLPHDWLTWRLRQSRGASIAVTEATTDRGQPSVTQLSCPRWPPPPRWWGKPAGVLCSLLGPATTWLPRSASAWNPATWS